MSVDRISMYPSAGQGDRDGGASITCPQCGTVSQTSLAGRHSSDFCPTCDYPLFWARSSDVVANQGAWSPDALRRAPGVAGTLSVATIACPECGELNLPEAEVCARCGADMHPAPVFVAPIPAPQPVSVITQQIIAPDHWPPWLVATLTACIAIAGTLAVVHLWG